VCSSDLGCDAFVLNEWSQSAIRHRVDGAYSTEMGQTIGKNARNTVEKKLNFDSSARVLADFISQRVMQRSLAHEQVA
jgi:hypothetical protein